LCPILLYAIIRQGENYGFYGNVRRNDSSYRYDNSYYFIGNFYHNRDNSQNKRVHYYSNAFGMAVWGILYNDGVVTDDELEFIQVIIDNGVTHDDALILMEDLSSNYHFSDEYHSDITKDDNYYLLMEMIENK